MAGHGIPRSFRHVDGFGVHTYRFVTDNGTSKLVKFHWKTLQGKASFVWEEAQQTAGKNADFIRQDLWDAIEAGRYPEWEVSEAPREICLGKILTLQSLVCKSWTKTINFGSALIFLILPRLSPRNTSQSPHWVKCSSTATQETTSPKPSKSWYVHNPNISLLNKTSNDAPVPTRPHRPWCRLH